MIGSTLIALALASYLDVAGDHAALYQGSLEPAFPQSLWITHPYWEDEEFHQGSICYDGNLYPSVQLRYNIYANVLSVVAPESKIVVVPDPDKVEFFTMDGMLFIKENGRFYSKPYQGRYLSLINVREKHKTADVLDDRVYKHNLTSSSDFYLCKPDGSRIKVSNRRSLGKALPQYKKALRHYCSNYGLVFDAKNRMSSLVSSITYLDELYAQHPGQQDTFAVVQLPEIPQSVYLSPSPRSVPDSILSVVEPVQRVSAYYAYTPGSNIKLEYSEDDDFVIENPGISNLEVLRESRTLEEVEVMGFRNQLAMQQGGMESFRPSLLKNVPLVMGEADVLKLAMMLPGVSSTGEVSSGLNVRGGASEQNLILYNGNTIFNPMHLFGLFSAFNSDLIVESELYKGGVPSQFGGRLSSVMNIKGRVADMQKFNGSVSIGLVTAKAMLELPLTKDRVSLLVGGRTTYSDWMLKRLPSKSGYRDGRAGFWDLGGTLHIQINNRHSLNLNGYYSNDRFSFVKKEEYGYTNTNFSAELRSRYDERWTTVVTLGTDRYAFNNDQVTTPAEAARLSFQINQPFLKGLATYRYDDAQTFNFGAQMQLDKVMPGSYQPLGNESFIVGRRMKEVKAIEGAVWAEDSWTINDRWSLTGGARLNLFRSMQEGKERLYLQPDWRVSVKYAMNENNALKVSFNTLHQYIHKVSNTVIMSPTDTWVLSNDRIKPQSGWQGALGWYLQSTDMVYELSVEGYYKETDHYLTYRTGANLVMNEEIHRDVVGTHGRAYGIEVQLRKLTGKLNGWINYTYSRSQLRQEGHKVAGLINRGRWFDSDYDAPHDVKLVGNYKFTRRYSTSLNVNYKTGRPYTSPVGIYHNGVTYSPVFLDRNTSRMPDYMRVDWSFNVEPSHHLTEKTHRWLTFGVYNLLGRKNAYSIYYESVGTNLQGYQLSVFGAPIPYITYNIKF